MCTDFKGSTKHGMPSVYEQRATNFIQADNRVLCYLAALRLQGVDSPSTNLVSIPSRPRTLNV